jgi:hypothetical protein
MRWVEVLRDGEGRVGEVWRRGEGRVVLGGIGRVVGVCWVGRVVVFWRGRVALGVWMGVLFELGRRIMMVGLRS